MVVVIPDVLSADELKAVRAQLQQAPWLPHQSAGPQARLAKNNLQIPEGAAMLGPLRVLVMRALNRSDRLISAVLPNKVAPPNFNRYEGLTNAYGPHTDSSIRYLNDGSCLRTDVSATLFLSDPDDYDGGALCVQDTYGEHRFKQPAGSLVVYPSGSIHEVKAVTRGVRLACYLFIQSVVQDTECRALLYEMDQSLMRLRAQHGEQAPELIRLTGVYNNLLRRWSSC